LAPEARFTAFFLAFARVAALVRLAGLARRAAARRVLGLGRLARLADGRFLAFLAIAD
jgi:hypothetical protein